ECTLFVSCEATFICTLTADDISPSICVEKNVTGHGHFANLTAGDFTVSFYESHMTLHTGMGMYCTPPDFHAGIFTVTETNQPDYLGEQIICYDNNTHILLEVHGYVNTTYGTIAVGLNQTVVCIIYNLYEARPSKLEFIKIYRDNWIRDACIPP